jgi:hypothetical protein
VEDQHVHLRAGEFGALPDDLLNGVKEVAFGSNLAPCTYGKHASLHVNDETILGSSDVRLHTSVATDRNSAPVVFGHRARNKIKTNLPLYAHTSGVNSEDVGSPLVVWQ